MRTEARLDQPPVPVLLLPPPRKYFTRSMIGDFWTFFTRRPLCFDSAVETTLTLIDMVSNGLTISAVEAAFCDVKFSVSYWKGGEKP
jgi:hypothetical protein